MKYRYLFEWMDFKWIPKILRRVLFSALDYSLSTLRKYYQWVSKEIFKEIMYDSKYSTIIEIGAGTGRCSLELYELIKNTDITIRICDINPDIEYYQEIEKKTNGKIRPIYNSVSADEAFKYIPENALVFFSSSFHHFTLKVQKEILKSLSQKTKRIMIFEPLQRNIKIFFMAITLFVPLIWFPLFKPKFSHFLWGWLIPVVPILLTWDGVISCLRMHTKEEWELLLKDAGITETKGKYIENNVNHAINLDFIRDNTNLFVNIPDMEISSLQNNHVLVVDDENVSKEEKVSLEVISVNNSKKMN